MKTILIYAFLTVAFIYIAALRLSEGNPQLAAAWTVAAVSSAFLFRDAVRKYFE